jgi:Flp pilus assembly protein protease CpaA
MPAFAPNLVLEGLALGGTAACLAWAAYHDYRAMIIPKVISFTILGLALPFHVLRGALLAGSGQSVWLLGGGNPILGAVDGLMLAFAGLLTGLAIFIPLWILKASGGGDVKVFAATAAVHGPTLALILLLITMVVVMVWTVAIMLLKARGGVATSPLGFAPPLLVAFLLLGSWIHVRDQNLIPPTDHVARMGVGHAR